MKKLIFFAVALCMGICAMAQSNFYVYKSDGTEVEFAVGEVDSISFVKPPFHAVFSVAADKTVKFSSGNLQYTRSTQKWAFAEHQYDIIGTDNLVGGTGEVSYDENYGYERTGKDLADKVDLFGWSGDKAAQPWGVDTINVDSAYAGAFADWGQNIGNGSTWRTLTNAEWKYLFYNRDENKYGTACIKLSETDSVNGLVLLPDNWTCPDGIEFKSGCNGYAAHQTFNLAQWQQMEQAGAVFLPAAGHRAILKVEYVSTRGRYWSATEEYTDEGAKYFWFGDSGISFWYINRGDACSVRLVQDVK